jgi:hypothetical protein
MFAGSFDHGLRDQRRKSGVVPSRCGPTGRHHEHESGQTIFLVAIALVVVLGMAALAVDVTFFYIAHSQAQKAADAAALAGAKAFVTSGFTSWQLGDPASGGAQALVCNGTNGFADAQAKAAANQNKIAGAPATTVTTTCTFAAGNPQITVNLSRTDLPIFFGRVWSSAAVQVSATAKAEAYNPSGESVPIEVGSVKPWLVTNCPPIGNCYFLDPATYQIQTPSPVGQTIDLQEFQLDVGTGLPVGILPPVIPSIFNTFFRPLNIPITAATASCPSSSAPSCGSVDPGGPGYFETVACANSLRLQCGLAAPQGVTGYTLLTPPTDQAAMCLVHADALGLAQGQDVITAPAPGSGLPVEIDGGFNNPNSSLRGVLNISRSDSVVSVPLFDGRDPACALGLPVGCNINIIGFLQLAITKITKPAVGPLTVVVIEAVVLNISGCGAAPPAANAVAGGGVAPIPVRLVQ